MLSRGGGSRLPVRRVFTVGADGLLARNGQFGDGDGNTEVFGASGVLREVTDETCVCRSVWAA